MAADIMVLRWYLENHIVKNSCGIHLKQRMSWDLLCGILQKFMEWEIDIVLEHDGVLNPIEIK